jgi:hypothetical protein
MSIKPLDRYIPIEEMQLYHDRLVKLLKAMPILNWHRVCQPICAISSAFTAFRLSCACSTSSRSGRKIEELVPLCPVQVNVLRELFSLRPVPSHQQQGYQAENKQG